MVDKLECSKCGSWREHLISPDWKTHWLYCPVCKVWARLTTDEFTILIQSVSPTQFK